MRLALGIEYDGSAFHGWQRQNGLRTVQECIEKALARVANQAITVVVAGRTDAGVHAGGIGDGIGIGGQVAHFDPPVYRPQHAWLMGANCYLPADIAIQWICAVPEDFHARFSATARHYRYFIYNARTRPALNRTRITWERRQLNITPMRLAAQYLIGTHDFSAYRAQGCQAKTPIRTLYQLAINQEGRIFTIDAIANAFLHHMVRNLVGVLVTIGAGEHPPGWAGDILASLDRGQGGVTAPAEGLHLVGVEYPARFKIPPQQPWDVTGLTKHPSSM